MKAVAILGAGLASALVWPGPGEQISHFLNPAPMFPIVSASMAPTLVPGDYVMLMRLAADTPERGAVVAYYRADPAAIYIVRVVGLAGDRIQLRRGHLHINGTPVMRDRLADHLAMGSEGRTRPIKRWRETLPGGRRHETLDETENGLYDNTPEMEVPAGHVFMLGDNRDNSLDSRAREVGTVRTSDILAANGFILFSIDAHASLWQFWRWPWAVRWNRLFTLVS